MPPKLTTASQSNLSPPSLERCPEDVDELLLELGLVPEELLELVLLPDELMVVGLLSEELVVVGLLSEELVVVGELSEESMLDELEPLPISPI